MFLVLDGIKDPHNLGACFRTADGAGVAAVVAPKDNSSPLNETARKIACGGAESVPCIFVTNLARALDKMKDAGMRVVGTSDAATASIYAADPAARERAHRLFAPVGTVADLADEDLMHAATGVSGSAPAYLYAFVEALEAAGAAAGLPPADSARLARSTIVGAAALLAQSGEEPAELRRQVTSPGGTTQAALEVLMGESGFPDLLRKAVAAAARRSKELGG